MGADDLHLVDGSAGGQTANPLEEVEDRLLSLVGDSPRHADDLAIDVELATAVVCDPYLDARRILPGPLSQVCSDFSNRLPFDANPQTGSESDAAIGVNLAQPREIGPLGNVQVEKIGASDAIGCLDDRRGPTKVRGGTQGLGKLRPIRGAAEHEAQE